MFCQEYLTRLDPSTSLGLNEDSIYNFSIGDMVFGKGLLSFMLINIIYLLILVLSCHINYFIDGIHYLKQLAASSYSVVFCGNVGAIGAWGVTQNLLGCTVFSREYMKSMKFVTLIFSLRPPPNFMQNGLNDVDLSKDVPFSVKMTTFSNPTPQTKNRKIQHIFRLTKFLLNFAFTIHQWSDE